MRLLLIHQNFPAQFRDLAGLWIERGHEVVGIGRSREGPMPDGITLGLYEVGLPASGFNGRDPDLELGLRRALEVKRACRMLRDQGWSPDAVVFHSSWGEGLYLRDVWPDQRLVGYPELHASLESIGYGFDPELGEPPEPLKEVLHHLNLFSEAAIADCDALICPTRHQRDSFPPHLRERFHVIHEGVDLQRVCANRNRWLVLGPDLAFQHGDPVITFCNRHLEPLRGLPTFLRALALLQQRHSGVQAIVVGENSRGYGPPGAHPHGCANGLVQELEGQLDLNRVHFVGHVAYEQLLAIFQISAAHVYLTYPYVLSWSLLEAMACEAPLIGSANAPVNEVIKAEVNGLLVDFNSPEQLCDAMLRLLHDPDLRQRLGQEARRTVARNYRLEDCADAYEAVFRGEPIAGSNP